MEIGKRCSHSALLVHRFDMFPYLLITSITPYGATNGASEIVGLARAKLRRGTSS